MGKTRILLAAGAALSAAALALTVPGLAGAAATPATATAATHMVTSSSLAGVVRPAGAAISAARSGAAPESTAPANTVPASTVPASAGAPAASCTEPACDLTYHGGPVQHSPHVYLLFWGPKWKSAAAEKAAASYLQKFFKGLGKSPQDSWSVTAMQYTDKKGHPAVGKAE